MLTKLSLLSFLVLCSSCSLIKQQHLNIKISQALGPYTYKITYPMSRDELMGFVVKDIHRQLKRYRKNSVLFKAFTVMSLGFHPVDVEGHTCDLNELSNEHFGGKGGKTVTIHPACFVLKDEEGNNLFEAWVPKPINVRAFDVIYTLKRKSHHIKVSTLEIMDKGDVFRNAKKEFRFFQFVYPKKAQQLLATLNRNSANREAYQGLIQESR